MEKETYYQEILRLQRILENRVEDKKGDDPVISGSKKELAVKATALNSSVLKLSAQVEELEEENRRLREEKPRGSQEGNGTHCQTTGMVSSVCVFVCIDIVLFRSTGKQISGPQPVSTDITGC